MRKVLLLITVLLTANILFAQNIQSVCIKINELNDNILLGNIKKQQAIAPFKALMAELNRLIKTKQLDNAWVFPLQGYKPSAIGGTNGNGYSDRGYNYFDGNKHAAHPAHDIFIRDKNQDDIDDKTLQPVNVLAMADGIVLACRSNWDEKSDLRGGRYIWIYHPQLNIISYYAHNREIFVKPGDEVKGGQKIAEVGRTGFNAFKKRSPTHLHFGTYHLQNGLPIPFNAYNQLIKAQIK
ncbi:M23 family metallopeptidase [Mucilaginibacter mali]|uniref:M23 family metallopeptidase n=1 Tax=Mucilaginibacter mali TaxID=2740462 RepID=A0A7D4QQK6_9SPHI|nr:M23 family metallopeptidase [Mucilaginibacter mali]QKJ29149.1 M23 family metallopeptidase [Mucilaginibacter mali]